MKNLFITLAVLLLSRLVSAKPISHKNPNSKISHKTSQPLSNEWKEKYRNQFFKHLNQLGYKINREKSLGWLDIHKVDGTKVTVKINLIFDWIYSTTQDSLANHTYIQTKGGLWEFKVEHIYVNNGNNTSWEYGRLLPDSANEPVKTPRGIDGMMLDLVEKSFIELKTLRATVNINPQIEPEPSPLHFPTT